MTYRHFNNETTRSSVLKAVADTRNEAAWARFFDLYAGLIFSIARSKGMKEEDADEFVIDIFVELMKRLPDGEYNRTKGSFRIFLMRLVRWRILDKRQLALHDKKRMDAYIDEKLNMPPAEKELIERKMLSTMSDEEVDAIFGDKEVALIDNEFIEREWQAAALEEALRRIKDEVRPEHYAAFYASAIEGQDTETVMRLYNLSRDNLYQPKFGS